MVVGDACSCSSCFFGFLQNFARRHSESKPFAIHLFLKHQERPQASRGNPKLHYKQVSGTIFGENGGKTNLHTNPLGYKKANLGLHTSFWGVKAQLLEHQI